MLFQYAERKTIENPEIDYLIFGHRHIPMQLKVGEKAEVVILGDWISHFSYGVFENGKMEIKFFKE
jgi:UDP-2,3-diacylglucosamine hydrolase